MMTEQQTQAASKDAIGAPVDRPVGRLVPERDDEAARLAHKMAKAAGPQKASVMARAAYMLVCCAALTTDPEGYFDWLEKQ
jgi:hypothetical protein